MDKKTLKAIADVMNSLVSMDAYKAAKYLSPTLVVRASRRLHRRRLPSKRDNVEVVLTIGRPNYEHREFIKDCKAAKEPFPVKGVILQFPPEQRKKGRK